MYEEDVSNTIIDKFYNEPEQLVSADDIRQQIDMLEKSDGSIKNIKSGFNKMLELGLIKDSNIEEQFSNKNFPSLLLEIKIWVKKHKRNNQWPSFLNDIKVAVSSYTFSISDDSSFTDTIRFFVNKKLGSHLSDDKVTAELAANTPDIKGTTKITTKEVYKSWICGKLGRHKFQVDIFTQRLKNLDTYLNAKGLILKKGNFISLMNRNQGQNGNVSRTTFEPFSTDFQMQVNAYCDWKIHSKRPDSPVQFKDLKTKEKVTISAINYTPWTQNSDGEANSSKHDITIFKHFYSYVLLKLDVKKPQLSMLFDADFLREFIQFITINVSLNVADKALDIVLKESKKNTFTAHYLIPEKFDTYSDWLDELEYVRIIVNDLKKHIKKNIEKIEGNRNVKFIINNSNPWRIYNEMLSIMRKIMNIKGHSLWTHASYLAFNWMVYCPLRIRNLAMLKWLGPISENDIYKLEDDKEIGIFKIKETGVFGVFVHKSHLKNKDSKSVTSVFQYFTGLTSIFEEYIVRREKELFRLNVESEYWAFAVSGQGKNGIGGRVTHTHVGNELVTLSQQAFSVMYPEEYRPGINPHGMRHLSATLFLNDNPKEYLALSTLLMDDLNTVMSVYATIDRDKDSREISSWAERRMQNAA